MYANAGLRADPEVAVPFARTAEECGFDSLWAVEHMFVPRHYERAYPGASADGAIPGGDSLPIPDPLTWLAFVAGVTTTITLATGILILPQRHPLTTGKIVATLDRLSGGRVVLGVGLGWMPEEYHALDLPFRGRARRLEEAIEIMRNLWGGEFTAFAGEHFRFPELISLPTPPRPSVPIVLGGFTPASAARAGRIGDGYFPGASTFEELEGLVGAMREAAGTAGRHPGSIEVTVMASSALDDRSRLEALGVSRVLYAVQSRDVEKMQAKIRALASVTVEKEAR